jgi:biopolymer transport protein ExbD/biopolymer transport protein TolR
MGAQLGSSNGPMADINVTPLIDVVLVLLVVFMVVTPMLQAGLPVDLPVATESEVVNDVGQFVVISVTKDQGWWVEQNEVTDATLISAINAELNENPTVDVDGVETPRSILVKADRALPYGDVRKVMDLLAKNRMTTVLVAANKEK